jgi:hypothetical protein
MDNLKIALLCNYELLPERVGGMDSLGLMQFKRNNIQVGGFR